MQETELEKLRRITLNTFPVLDCKKALVQCNGNTDTAAEFLTDGKWRHAKSISWDYDSIEVKAKELAQQTTQNLSTCRYVLMNCAGNLELAFQKLSISNRPKPNSYLEVK